jgi:DnaK suppressor protein
MAKTKLKAKAKVAATPKAVKIQTRPAVDKRYQELKHILENRARELQAEIQAGISRVGTGQKDAIGADQMDQVDIDIARDLDLAMTKMKAEVLAKINGALERLEKGTFGKCAEPECGEPISVERIRALPFVIRCKDCEERREIASQKERRKQLAAGRFGRLG